MTLSYPPTLADLRTRVQNRLLTSSTATDHWSAEKIRTALNRAQVELQMELLQVFDARYFTASLDTLEPENGIIPLPEDFIRLVTFEKAFGDHYIPVTMVPPSQTVEYRYSTPIVVSNPNGSLTREIWSLIGDRLESPHKTVTGTYRLRYTHRIADLQSDESKSQIPPQFTDHLVDNASMKLAKDAGEDKRAALIQGDYEKSLQIMRSTAGRVAPTANNRIRRTYRRSTWALGGT